MENAQLLGLGLLHGPLDKLKNQVTAHILKGALARHISNAGMMGENAALALIEAGHALPGPVPPLVIPTPSNPMPTAAATGMFSNVIAAIQSFIASLPQNLGPDVQLLIQVAPLILQLLAIFGVIA